MLSARVRPYRRMLAAAGVGLAVTGAMAGTYLLVAGGLAGLRARPSTTPTAASEGMAPDASDDPAVTVLRPTPSPASAPTPAATPRHSVTAKPRSTGTVARPSSSRSATGGPIATTSSDAQSTNQPPSDAGAPPSPQVNQSEG